MRVDYEVEAPGHQKALFCSLYHEFIQHLSFPMCRNPVIVKIDIEALMVGLGWWFKRIIKPKL